MSETLELRPLDRDSSTLRSEDGTNDTDGRLVQEAGINEKKQQPIGNDVERAKGGVAAVDPDSQYVTGVKLVLIFLGMLLSIFLVALDQTIVSTAIPVIASQFNALEQVTWIASAYFLTQASFILFYGQLLRIANTKWVYLSAITIFEIGSLICGVAPNINVLIFGRAFAGVGAAGIFVSALAIMATITRIEQRPLMIGLLGSVYALSAVIGPLMGGAFTDHVSWRWCFYINLPFGAFTIASIILVIKPSHSIAPQHDGVTIWQKTLIIDWIGTFLCVGFVTSLLLPLQWGGVTKAWSSPPVIVCLILFGVVLSLFIGWEWYKGDKASMPLSLWKHRTQIGCCIEGFFLMLMLLCGTYYLPLYYQSAKGHSATRSGIDILAFMIPAVVGAGGSGAIINKTGRPLPFLIISPLFMSLGSGLIFWTLTSDSPSAAKLAGFQVLLGFGVGGAMQNVITTIQAEYHDKPIMVPQATSLVNFTQLVGGIVGIAVSGSVFGNRLSSGIALYAPELDSAIAIAVKQSVKVIATLEGAEKAAVIKAYSEALGYVFIIGIPAGILGSLAALFVKNLNLKEMNIEPGMAIA